MYNLENMVKEPDSNSDERFSGKIGEEYELLKMSYPHYDELQNVVGTTIKEKFASFAGEEIKVLEIGCGTGITSKVILDAEERVHLVALDNEKLMLSQAKEKLSDERYKDKIDFVEADALKYLQSLENESLEVVASGYVLHNLKSDIRDMIISEIYRVLKKEGIFINADKYAFDDKAEHERSYKEQIERFDVYDTIGRSDYKEEWIKHFAEDNKDEVIFREGEATKFLEKIGFRNVKTAYRKYMDAVIVGTK